ncbi:hypothetical protein Tco_1097727 [Tanacetum coccineum]
MEILGSVGNNTDPRVYVVDGRPLKSILNKPKESSIVLVKDGCVRTDFADRNQPIEVAVGATADPNQSGWFEATIKPEGVKGSNKVGSSGEGQFGLQNIMKSDDGVFLFKFASKVGLEKVLERSPWMIRNSPIILSKWSPYVSMTPKEVTKVTVWIKLHKIPLVAYSKDGLSLIATQVRKPIMLDAFTSSMCNDPWGRISYARALVEISAGTDLKTEVSMVVPNEDGEGYTREVISVEYEWKSPHYRDCKVFGHTHDTCPNNVNKLDPNATTKADHSDGFTEASQAAQGKSDSLKPNLNPFDALNTLSEEDISGNQKPISYDTDDANMDVGAEGGVFSSTDTQNEDLESDEEVDELIFSEGDKFDIQLKGRSKQ